MIVRTKVGVLGHPRDTVLDVNGNDREVRALLDRGLLVRVDADEVDTDDVPVVRNDD